MADKMWLVSCGSYSDYTVIAAFTSREKAQAFADRANEPDQSRYENYMVEETECDPAPWPGKPYYACTLKQTGVPWYQGHNNKEAETTLPPPEFQNYSQQLWIGYGWTKEEALAAVQAFVASRSEWPAPPPAWTYMVSNMPTSFMPKTMDEATAIKQAEEQFLKEIGGANGAT